MEIFHRFFLFLRLLLLTEKAGRDILKAMKTWKELLPSSLRDATSRSEGGSGAAERSLALPLGEQSPQVTEKARLPPRGSWQARQGLTEGVLIQKEKTMKKVILTGDRPTGRLHVGHYVGSLKERVRLQNSGEYDEIYVMIADAQALTDNADNPEKVRQNILQVALDYLACGIDPAKTHIFIQSMVPELTELSFYYMNLVTVSRLQRNPTVKSEIHMRNFETSIPVGFFCYPISQAADITAFHATTVPAGEDQKPMIEQCCEIVRKFNSVYGDTLVEPEIVLPQNAACLRLPGIDGKAKMSKSLGNCIYLSEEPEDIKKKVMSMYTDPNHLRVQDPGQVEGNPVFIYLDAFCRPEHFAEFWPEYQNLDEVKAHYQRGGLGDVKVKKFLNSVMQAELEPIRTRRKEWEQRLPEVVEILKEGSAYAEKTAAATLDEVRKAMRIDYFENDNLLK
jgi:tryptophanyl-tRNA synthetase